MKNKKGVISNMQQCWLISQYSNCCSKKVGCVIVKDDRIISVGYNGTVSGYKNCSEHAKECGWTFEENGVEYLDKDKRHLHSEWSSIHEVHAEQNAMDFALKNGISINGAELYCTHTPCIECVKRIVNSGISKVYFSIYYDKTNESWDNFLKETGVEVEFVDWNSEEFNKHLNTENFIFDLVK